MRLTAESNLQNISLIFFHSYVFLFTAEDHGSEGTNSAAVIVLSLLSGILCLAIIGYFVYHRRRVLGTSAEPLRL